MDCFKSVGFAALILGAVGMHLGGATLPETALLIAMIGAAAFVDFDLPA